MKKITVSDDIVPVAEFKSGLSRYLKSLRETGHPLIITQNGRPAGVLITPSEYDQLTYKQLFTESVLRGAQEIESGELYSTDEIKEMLKAARKARQSQ